MHDISANIIQGSAVGPRYLMSSMHQICPLWHHETLYLYAQLKAQVFRRYLQLLSRPMLSPEKPSLDMSQSGLR